MPYRILLFSLKPQHESAIGIHISLSFQTSLPSPSLSHPSRLIQSSCLSFPETQSKFPLAIYFTYGNVSFHVTLSIHLTLSSPLPMSISLFSTFLWRDFPWLWQPFHEGHIPIGDQFCLSLQIYVSCQYNLFSSRIKFKDSLLFLQSMW